MGICTAEVALGWPWQTASLCLSLDGVIAAITRGVDIRIAEIPELPVERQRGQRTVIRAETAMNVVIHPRLTGPLHLSQNGYGCRHNILVF